MGRENVIWHEGSVTRTERWSALDAHGATVWLTGLSGSGKSTLAAAVERRFVTSGRPAYRLDGDNLRTGLNGDLDFSRAGREENIRRVAEVAALFTDAGMTTLVALISPYARARAQARSIHERAGLKFIEVYVAASIELCSQRDPKGLYVRANEGKVAAFTGVDDPYEIPKHADLTVPGDLSVDEAVEMVVQALD